MSEKVGDVSRRSTLFHTLLTAALANAGVGCGSNGGSDDGSTQPSDDAGADTGSGSSTGEITEDVPLLDDDGTLSAHGWARAPHMQFDSSKLQPDKVANLREWEYFAVNTADFSMSFTLTDLGILAFAIPTVEDYTTGMARTGLLVPDPATLQLPPTPFENTLVDMADAGTYEYRFEEGKRSIDVVTPQFEAHVELEDSRDADSIAVTHAFDDPGLFFYENKRLPMKASGTAVVEGDTYTLPDTGAYAVMDWGRGAWPSTVKWEWAHFTGETDGHVVGVNLGTVFADDSPGSADALFVDGVLHKLGRVEWTYDREQVMQPWTFTSDDGRVSLTLTPIFDDSTLLPFGEANQLERWKAHGTISGTVEMDDGTELQIEDLHGAAEYVEILW